VKCVTENTVYFISNSIVTVKQFPEIDYLNAIKIGLVKCHFSQRDPEGTFLDSTSLFKNNS